VSVTSWFASFSWRVVLRVQPEVTLFNFPQQPGRCHEAMREAMFFGETPDFDEILVVVGDFERRFNKTA
jgi:hypothetical protein